MDNTPGLAVRTPIHFGQAVEHAIKSTTGNWFPMETRLDSERFLLFVYQKRLDMYFHGFMLLQGSRKTGKFTAEMGIANRKAYPVHYGRSRPSLVVSGVRERAAVVYRDVDKWWPYTTQRQLEDQLCKVITDLVRKGIPGLSKLYSQDLRKQMKRAEDLVDRWRAAEANATAPLGSRYPVLKLEPPAYEYIQNAMVSPLHQRVLGTLRRRYQDDRWMAAHTYLMAFLLETVEPSEFEVEEVIPMVEEDDVLSVTGRVPSNQFLEMPDTMAQQMLQYSYFKSLEMLDAFFDLEKKPKKIETAETL